MFPSLSARLYPVQTVLQRAALGLIALLATAAVLWSLAALAGLAPWLGLGIRLGDATVEAGPAVQIGLAALLAGLCFFLPGNARILALETSHRSFQVTMWDVARAYQIAHAADRAGAFTLRGEFDGIRERIHHLRREAALDALEPELLELAAQMSHESRELAEIYSDEKVERARAFLRQREEEAETLKARLQAAHAACRTLKGWMQAVEAEEDVARARLAGLRAELDDLLPLLRLRPEDAGAVLPFRGYAAE